MPERIADDGCATGADAQPARRHAGLSKSSIAAFEQCPKRLWLAFNRPDAAERVDDDSRIVAGHMVGAVARSLLPAGKLVDEPDLGRALEATDRLLGDPATEAIFEATFAVEGVLVRVDILEADGSGGWRIAEVKSTTAVKAEHIGDLATQVWAVRHAGCRLTGAAVRHIDNTFVLTRDGDYHGAFVDEDVLADVQDLANGRPALIAAARATLAGDLPVHGVGKHCSDPHPCPFSDHCHSALPPGPDWPVTILPHGGGKRWVAVGVNDLLEIDEAQLANATHLKVHRATVTGETFHDHAGARAAIDAWPFPRTWLDFETIAFPLPRWVGTKPYEQVAFQFSAHVEHEDGRLDHHEFLSLDGEDPRRSCAEALARLPATGAVVAYNAPFERGCIERLAAAFPDLAAPLLLLSSRLVDLLPVTKANWYHRDQRGSWSIKAVLPTMTDLSYGALEVKDGMQAQAAYLEAIEGTSPERLATLDAGLRAYCGQDTLAMIAVARRLTASAAPSGPPSGLPPGKAPAS